MSTQPEFYDQELQSAFAGAHHYKKSGKRRMLPYVIGGSIVVVGGALALHSSHEPDPKQEVISAHGALIKLLPETAGDATYDILYATLRDPTASNKLSEDILRAKREKPEDFGLFRRIQQTLQLAEGSAQDHQTFAPANLAYVIVKDINGVVLSIHRLGGEAYTVATEPVQGVPSGIHGLVVYKISPTAIPVSPTGPAGTMPTQLPPNHGAYLPLQQLQPFQPQPLQPPLLEQLANPANPTGAAAPFGYQQGQPHGRQNSQTAFYQSSTRSPTRTPTLERLTSGAPMRYATHRVQGR